MKSVTSTLLAVAAALIVGTGPALVWAQDDPRPMEVESAPQLSLGGEGILAADGTGSVNADLAEHNVDLAIGIRAGASGSAGEGFEDDESVTDGDGTEIPSASDAPWQLPEYYPHGGAGGTGGLSVEGRYNDMFGLEVGLFYSRDNADGWVDKRDAGSDQRIARIHSEQRSSSLQIPVMLKVNAPGDLVRPFVAGGVNFINQTSSELDYRQEGTNNRRYATDEQMRELNDRNRIEPSSYVQATGSGGVELVAGDIKIPIELRVGYTLGYDSAMEERARGEDGQIIYDGIYLGHFGIFAGALYEFDLVP